MNCARPNCRGQIQDGYCDSCGLAPARPAPAAASSARPNGSNRTSTGNPPVRVTAGSTRSTSSPRSTRTVTATAATRGHLGAGLVEIAPVPTRDPLTVVLVDPQVPESKRFCGHCNAAVGRTRPGRPGTVTGYCPACRTPYSFAPKLKPGELVAGQYQVAGCLAHGGLGWVYLAQDGKVDARWVVLKGLLNSGDDSAMAAAIAERSFLAQVEHANIVRIYNFVEHDGAGYIVMEYAGGQSLKALRQDESGAPAPVPAAVGIGYMIDVLPALAHLHSRGLLYCDFKPDNVIQTPGGLKVIDLGGVRRIDDDSSDLYGTIGYQAPEIAEEGASISSDLYTVARTLAVMTVDFPGFQDPARYAYSLPPVRDVPLFGRYPSLHRFLAKGTHPDPDRRFQSADEMREQLLGVLRQVLAVDGERRHPVPSRLFSADLGADGAMPEWRSLPLTVVDPEDPAAGVLAALATTSGTQLLAGLSAAPAGAETDFHRAKGLLETGDAQGAYDVLTSRTTGYEGEWKASWWRGLVDLADDRPQDAAERFAEVAAEVPGELAPILAMAVAAETAGDDDAARGAYQVVAATDDSFVTASFGVARILRRRGDRNGSVSSLRQISTKSSAYQPSRAAIVSTLIDPGLGEPSSDDLLAASEALIGITGDPALRAGLTRDLLVAALELIRRQGPDPSLRVATVPLEEAAVRPALERACRTLAKLAPTEAERFRLVDQANAYRARTLL